MGFSLLLTLYYIYISRFIYIFFKWSNYSFFLISLKKFKIINKKFKKQTNTDTKINI